MSKRKKRLLFSLPEEFYPRIELGSNVIYLNNFSKSYVNKLSWKLLKFIEMVFEISPNDSPPKRAI